MRALLCPQFQSVPPPCRQAGRGARQRCGVFRPPARLSLTICTLMAGDGSASADAFRGSSPRFRAPSAMADRFFGPAPCLAHSAQFEVTVPDEKGRPDLKKPGRQWPARKMERAGGQVEITASRRSTGCGRGVRGPYLPATAGRQAPRAARPVGAGPAVADQSRKARPAPACRQADRRPWFA